MPLSRYFFATRDDLLAGFARFEAAGARLYVEAGVFDAPTCRRFTSGADLPDLGSAPSGDDVREPRYLVLPAGYEVSLRSRRINDGRLRFYADPQSAPEAAVFWPGGAYDSQTLIAGAITPGATAESRALSSLMVRLFTKGFRRVNMFWLGPNALALFDAGARLTKAISMSRNYDLRRFP